MKRLAGRRLLIWGVFACFLAMAGWMFRALETKPITLGKATFETGADGNSFAIMPMVNRSPYYYTFRFKRNTGDVPCMFRQQGTAGQTQWLGNTTLARSQNCWPRPILPGETIYLRVPVQTNASTVAGFELLPVKTVYDHNSIVWDLRRAGERLGVLTENITVRTQPLAVP